MTETGHLERRTMLVNPARLLDRLLTWPVRTQHGSRRNALVAATALAERRREVAEVAEFLERRAAAAAAAAGADETARVAVRQAR